MRSSIVARCFKVFSRLVSLFCAAALCCSLVPSAAFAADEGSLSLIPEGEQGATLIASGTEGSSDDGVSHSASDDASSVDESSAASTSENADDKSALSTKESSNGYDEGASVPDVGVIDQVQPSQVMAQQESVRSFFLAQTLESTRTVSMVSASLPLDSGMTSDLLMSTENEDSTAAEDEGKGRFGESGLATDGIIAPESTVVGSFVYRGITYAVEPGGESVAVVAADYAKLPEDFIEAQTIVLPSQITTDCSDCYAVVRIADYAFESFLPPVAPSIDLMDVNAALGSSEKFANEVKDVESDVLSFNTVSTAVELDDEINAPAHNEESDAFGNHATSADEEDVEIGYSISVEAGKGDQNSNDLFETGIASSASAIVIPPSVTTIEPHALAGFETLEHILVVDANPCYSTYDGCLYDSDQLSLLVVPEGRTTAVHIAPGTTNIDPGAFARCLVDSVLIADKDVDAASTFFANCNVRNARDDLVDVVFDANSDPLVTSCCEKIAGEIGDTIDAFDVVEDGLTIDSPLVLAKANDSASLLPDGLVEITSPEPTLILARTKTNTEMSYELISIEARNDSDNEAVTTLDTAVEYAADLGALGFDIAGEDTWLQLIFSGSNRSFLAGRMTGSVSWSAGTSASPAIGSIVTVDVTTYHPTGGETTKDNLVNAGLGWGGNESRELIGMRNVVTGSYVTLDAIYSGELFSFSFLMPATGCAISSKGITYISAAEDTSFQPVYSDRANSIYSTFLLNGGDCWENPATGVRSQSGSWGASVYSTIGSAILTPSSSIPVRDGYIFEGWYTAENGGAVVTGDAQLSNNGATYYAHWKTTSRMRAYENKILQFAPGKSTRSFLADLSQFCGTVSWSSDTDIPVAGSIVNVHVDKYRPNGAETTRDSFVNASFEWGASASKELIGIRNTTTGSYLDIDTLYSGNSFSFSYVMPNTGKCVLDETGIYWIDSIAGTSFEPVFQERAASIVIHFLATEGFYENPSTSVIGTASLASSYSLIGGAVLAPSASIPVRAGYEFSGWYSSPIDGDPLPSVATADLDGRTYYAQWIDASYSMEIRGWGQFTPKGNDGRSFLADTAHFEATAYWQTGTADMPSAGSIVVVRVTNYRPNASETTKDMLVNAGLEFGGSAARKLIGIRNADTGAYWSIDSFYSGNVFELSFKMPEASKITFTPAKIAWVNATTFEPVFENVDNMIYNSFVLNNPGAQWKNPLTGQHSLVGNSAGATTYSKIGSEILMPANSIAVCDGYLFKGWYTAAEGGNSVSGDAIATDNGKTYYAQWATALETNYLLTLNSNIPGDAQTRFGYVGDGISYDLKDDIFERTGYSLTRWTTDESGLGVSYPACGSIVGVAGQTLTLYAQWELDRYNITYDYADGRPTETAYFDYGEGVFNVPDPTRTGYTFLGWIGTGLDEPTKNLSLAKDSNDKIGEHAPGTNTYVRIYTATWKVNTYEIAFDIATLDGAEWKTGEAPVTDAYSAVPYDAPVVFPNAPVRSGWIFTFWVRVDDPQGASYGATETVDEANFESEQDAIAEFEAHWVRNLEVMVPVGSQTVGMAVSADFTADPDTAPFEVNKASAEIVNLSDGEMRVASVFEDTADAAGLQQRKDAMIEAFDARGNGSAILGADAIGLVLAPTADGVVADTTKESVVFPLYSGHVFDTEGWRLGASTDPVHGTTASTLQVLYDMAFDYTKVRILDLKINLKDQPISKLIYTLELVDDIEPSYKTTI